MASSALHLAIQTIAAIGIAWQRGLLPLALGNVNVGTIACQAILAATVAVCASQASLFYS